MPGRTLRENDQFMKVCSICHRQYADSLKFCLDDGTVLSKAPEPPVTLVDPAATLRINPRQTDAVAVPKRRSPFFWLALAGVAVFLLVGLSVLAVLIRVGRVVQSSPSVTRNDQTPSATP